MKNLNLKETVGLIIVYGLFFAAICSYIYLVCKLT